MTHDRRFRKFPSQNRRMPLASASFPHWSNHGIGTHKSPQQAREEVGDPIVLMMGDSEEQRITRRSVMAAASGESRVEALTDALCNDYNCKQRRKPTTWIQTRVASLLFILLLTGSSFVFAGIARKAEEEDSHECSENSKVVFSCPSDMSLDKSYDPTSEYEAESKAIGENITRFLQTFRYRQHDRWGKSYTQIKEAFRPWKTKFFVPYVESGDSIYESANGIGMNLYMTLEILNEMANITDVVVYGNEYVDASTVQANAIFDLAAPHGARKGSMCTGDSVDLAFVPPNSFDLVFTGYISPLIDPLEFGGDVDSIRENKYRPLCARKDWESRKLAQLAQATQEDWHSKWVREMIRIAKPGAPVIVESVSPPFCEWTSGWGGVSRDFWSDAVGRYGWEIDPDSIEIFEDGVVNKKRYHVFMRKTDYFE